MKKLGIYRCLAIFGLACGLTISLTTAAHAIEMVLQGELVGKGSLGGKVQYVMFDKKVQTFSGFFQGAKPGEEYIVTVRRPAVRSSMHKLAWFRPNKAGRAIVDLSTKFMGMPYLQPNDVIEVWYGNERVMYGTIR